MHDIATVIYGQQCVGEQARRKEHLFKMATCINDPPFAYRIVCKEGFVREGESECKHLVEAAKNTPWGSDARNAMEVGPTAAMKSMLT